MYLNQLSGRLPGVKGEKSLPVNCKGNEIFSTTAQFLKEIDAVGENSKKLPLQSFTLQRYNKGVPQLNTCGNKIVNSLELSKHIGISETSIYRNIEAMRGKYLRRVGPDKGGFWEVLCEQE